MLNKISDSDSDSDSVMFVTYHYTFFAFTVNLTIFADVVTHDLF